MKDVAIFLIAVVVVVGAVGLAYITLEGKAQQWVAESRARRAEAEAEQAEAEADRMQAEAQREAARVARINAGANAFATRLQSLTNFIYDMITPPAIAILVIALVVATGFGAYSYGRMKQSQVQWERARLVKKDEQTTQT